MKPMEKSKFQKKLRFRIGIVYFMTFLSFTSLILRESYVEIVKGAVFRTQETTEQTEKIPILPERGWIYDANGQVLAYDVPTASVILNRFTSLPDSSYQRMAKELAPILSETKQSLYKQMTSAPGIWQVPKLSPYNWCKFSGRTG